MNAHNHILLVATLHCLSTVLMAAPFDSGSTGADGPLNVTSNMTLQLPADGIFHFTTITIESGATLSFEKNALNTPVYLLATGDILIDGAIDVSGNAWTQGFLGGVGGPGGFDGGNGGFALITTAGDGQGPGGGKGATARGTYGTNYSNALLSPPIGGSGGAGSNGSPGRGGGGGGGAIVVASSTRATINGVVYSRGGDGATTCETSNFGSGSGGAVRVVSPIVDGNGRIDTRGGLYHGRDNSFQGCGAASRFASSGRIRIDCIDRIAFRNLNYTGVTTRGSQMFVFPPVIPRLDIVEAAGTTIPEGTGQLVAIELPVGSPTNQIIRIQGRNFTNDVPIEVVVTPENGPSEAFSAILELASGNPPTLDVNVTIPEGIVSRIHAWTR